MICSKLQTVSYQHFHVLCHPAHTRTMLIDYYLIVKFKYSMEVKLQLAWSETIDTDFFYLAHIHMIAHHGYDSHHCCYCTMTCSSTITL